MSLLERYAKLYSSRGFAGLIAVLLLLGLIWETLADGKMRTPTREFVRTVAGVFYGKHAAPAEPGIIDTTSNTLFPEKRFRLMTIKHVPRINAGDGMPHPFVGPCQQCHLYRGGPGPGSQFKTPVGAALETISSIKKLGPPLHPDSHMPHPSAGRCIKCHDIIVKVPMKRKKDGLIWFL